jgi:hypothetical protein
MTIRGEKEHGPLALGTVDIPPKVLSPTLVIIREEGSEGDTDLNSISTS